jgi:hypothetical protein
MVNLEKSRRNRRKFKVFEDKFQKRKRPRNGLNISNLKTGY